MVSRIEELKPETRRWGLLATVGAAWLALLLALGFGTHLEVHVAREKTIDVMKVINEYEDAQHFAHNFVLVWAMGGHNQAQDDTAKLAAMTSFADQVELSVDPYTALDINLVPPITRTEDAGGGGEIEWGMTMAVTIIPPGRGSATRLRVRVVFLDAGGTFKALLWPRPVNETARAVQIKSAYVRSVEMRSNDPKNPTKKSVLGEKIDGFMRGYYQANNPGTLGSFTTQGFAVKDQPLVNSPYNAVEVTSIQATADSADPAKAQPGDKMHLRVTAKAMTSNETFSTIDVPLRVILSENKQWLVDGFEDPIHYGAVQYK